MSDRDFAEQAVAAAEALEIAIDALVVIGGFRGLSGALSRRRANDALRRIQPIIENVRTTANA